MGRTKKPLKVGKISAKEEILKIQEKQVAYIGNKKKRKPEMERQRNGG